MRHKYTYHEHRHKWYVKYTYFLIKLIFRPLVKFIFINKVEGLHHIPRKGPALIALNHQSYFDFICFIAVCPRHIHFLSAEKFFSNMFWSPLMKLTGQIKVERKEHGKDILHTTIQDHLKNEKIIGIFPEGTRSPHKDEMLHAFTGITKHAIRGKVPIIPVGIKGTFDVMSRNDKRPKLKKIVSIHIGEPIYFNDHFGKDLDEVVHRNLLDTVMLKISELSNKNYPHVGKILREKE